MTQEDIEPNDRSVYQSMSYEKRFQIIRELRDIIPALIICLIL